MKTNSVCRICASSGLERVLSLGPTPPANAFLKKEDLGKKEPLFPLDVYLCRTCGLLQLIHCVSPDLLFRDYVYASSTSPSFVDHFRRLARDLHARLGLAAGDLVVDVGSNDGILLGPFKELGMQVLGIDPAVRIAARATASGIETLPEYFGPDLARRLERERGEAALVTAANVFAHVDDLAGFLEAVKAWLKPGGVFLVEAPYLADLLDQNLFDTIYHEHLSYFAAAPLKTLFDRSGLDMFDIQRTDSHGGSLRVLAQKAGAGRAPDPSVRRFLEDEKSRNLGSLETYAAFARKVERNKTELNLLVEDLKSKGSRIAGYGAPAKGNTLLNYFQITSRVLDYIVDDSPLKQGLYTPGTHIPVVGPDRLSRDPPDCILILAWNFARPIMEKLSGFRKAGGRFLLPVPTPQLL